MIAVENRSNRLIQPPARAGRARFTYGKGLVWQAVDTRHHQSATQERNSTCAGQVHFTFKKVFVSWIGDVEHHLSNSQKQNTTCVELKKQGKEKKPDANLVGTPFPEP